MTTPTELKREINKWTAGIVARVVFFLALIVGAAVYGPGQQDYARGTFWLVCAVFAARQLDRALDKKRQEQGFATFLEGRREARR